MKWFPLLLGFFICTIAVGQSTDSFNWLQGRWVINSGKIVTFETWHKSEDGSWAGEGHRIKKGDTVFTEKLAIVFKNTDWYYVADVAHNAEPVYFKITQFGSDYFVAENSKHDFPQKIEYRLSESKLEVVISAANKKIPFTFSRPGLKF